MPTEYILNADQEKWLTALESGEYKQCIRALFDGVGFCSLGVACVAIGMNSFYEKLEIWLEKHYNTAEMLCVVVPLIAVFILLQYQNWMGL